MPSEAHLHSYTHGQAASRYLLYPEFLLPGGRDGKIWMCRRCLLCPRLNGFPPAICRVVISESARGYRNPEWLQNKVNQVVDRAELLFTEILNALRKIAIKRIGALSVKVAESRRHIGDLEELLQKEKEPLQKVLNWGKRKSEIKTDIHRLLRAAKS